VSDMVVDFFSGIGADEVAASVKIKWPNDILVGGCKICGILCERKGDRVIAGIGLNVNQTQFPEEIDAMATSLARAAGRESGMSLDGVRDAVLKRLGDALGRWRRDGFGSMWGEVVRRDFLKGKALSVLRTDSDTAPVEGLCGGIGPDGALLVGGIPVYAGEAHVVPSCS